MSGLGDAKRKFTLMIARLIIWAYNHGYELTLGEGYVSNGTGHMKGSLHYDGLAQDLNLFKDGIWLKNTEDHLPLGEEWERMGGAWGGRFKGNPDGNHYSLAYGGKK
jgi:hypothetical protein